MADSRTRGVDVSPGRVPTRPAEAARRDRIMDVAVALAERGGYHEVQMREVAEKAEVALGTLYRYFPSKSQLLAAAFARHLQRCGEEILAEIGWDAAPPARARAVLDGLIKRLGADPVLAGAWSRTLASASVGPSPRGAGPTDTGPVPTVGVAATSAITAAVFGPDSSPETLDAARRSAAAIIGKVFVHDLRFWLAGGMSDEDIQHSLADTVTLVLAGREVIAG